jgi:uracil-DNA glycosylase
MLAQIFSGQRTLDKDKDGNYFIDRNGKHFDHILDFLRDGKYLPPQDVIEEVLKDAKYFRL